MRREIVPGYTLFGFKSKTVSTRGVEFDPSALEKGLRSERVLKLALTEMDAQGVSTRKVVAITEKLRGLEVITAQVSRAASALDAELAKW